LFSGTSLLRESRREWPRALVPEGAFGLLVKAATPGPSFAAGVYAECHLSHADRTDLVVRLHPAHRDALLEAGCEGRLAVLLELWQDHKSPLSLVPAIDLESDLPGHVEPWFACPLFEPEFLGGVDGILRRDRSRASRGLAPLAAAAGPAILRAVHGAEIPQAILGHLERCRRAMPPWSAFMPGWVRPVRAGGPSTVVRALVTIARHQLLAYLAAIGWEGDAGALDAVLQGFGAGDVKVTADLTLGATGVFPTLGLYWERLRCTPRDASVTRVCRGIEGLGLPIVAARWGGLLDWIAARDDGPRRSLSLKLVLVQGAAPQLKAYIPNFDAYAALAAAVARTTGVA
jgi:hypothetical protein